MPQLMMIIRREHQNHSLNITILILILLHRMKWRVSKSQFQF